MSDGAGQVVGQISIKVTPDTSGFRKELAAQLKAIENSLKAKIEVEPDFKGFREKVRAMTSNLPDAKVKVDVDTSAVTKLGKFRQGILGITDSLSSAISGFRPMGVGIGVIAAGLALIAPALALASGALVGLPGLLAAFAVPAAAVALGLDGIKEAAKTLQPEFDALKATMSAAFQDKFTPIFEQMRQVFPTLSAEMPKVASGLADMAQGFVDSVKSSQGMANIQNTIDRVAESLSAAKPGIKSFTDGMLQLISSVSNHLPGLATFLNNFATRFSSWVDKITTRSWFTGKTPLETGMKSFKDALQGILDIVAKLGEKGFDFLSDPNFGKNMSDFINGVKDFTANTLPALGQFFLDVSDAIKTAVDAMNSAKGALPEGFLKRDPTKGADASGDTGLLNDNAGIVQALGGIQENLQQYIGRWRFDLIQMWADVAVGAQGALNGLVTHASSIVGSIVATFAQVPTQLQAAWSGLAGIASAAWQAVTAAVTQAFAGIVAAVVSGAAQVVAEVSAIPGKVAAALSGLYQVGVSAMNALGDGIVAGAINAASKAAAAAARVMAAIKDAIPHSPAKEGPFSGSGWTDVSSGGAAIVQSFASGISSQQAGIVSTVRELMQAVKDVFGDASGLTLNFNLGGLQDQVAGVAAASTDLKKSLSSSVAPSSGSIDSDTKSQIEQLKMQRAELELQAKQRSLEAKQATDKGLKEKLQQEAAALRIQKDQLAIQSDQLAIDAKANGQIEDKNGLYDDLMKKITNVPIDFAKATGGQFMQDLGIGGGALTAAADQALQFGSQFIFNVANTDDAMRIKTNEQNKQSLQHTQR